MSNEKIVFEVPDQVLDDAIVLFSGIEPEVHFNGIKFGDITDLLMELRAYRDQS